MGELRSFLFFGIADRYCEANNVDISREPNAGRGSVDFKFSSGYHLRVVVEVKFSRGHLVHGYTTQLPINKTGERALKGVYPVIENGAAEKKLKAFREIVAASGENSLEVRWIDGTKKLSASKAESP